MEGDDELIGTIFSVDLSWILSINDPNHPIPSPPTDVISYRIYRKIPPKALELVGTVTAGTEEFTDAFSMTSLNPVIAYTVCAWDGVYESEYAVNTGFKRNIITGVNATLLII